MLNMCVRPHPAHFSQALFFLFSFFFFFFFSVCQAALGALLSGAPWVKEKVEGV